MKQIHRAWRATTITQAERHHFSLDRGSEFISPDVHVYCSHSPSSQTSATCPMWASRSCGSQKICHNLGRTASHRSYFGYQSPHSTHLDLHMYFFPKLFRKLVDIYFSEYSPNTDIRLRFLGKKKSNWQQFHKVNRQTYVKSPPVLTSEELTR